MDDLDIKVQMYFENITKFRKIDDKVENLTRQLETD